MNWGGFAGGFSKGFMNGVSIGKTFDGLSKERRLQEIREKGIAEAKGLQESAIADLIKDNGVGEQPKPAMIPSSAQPTTPKEGIVESGVAIPPVGEGLQERPSTDSPSAQSVATPVTDAPASSSYTPATQITSTAPVASEPERAPQDKPSVPEIAAQTGVTPARKRYSVGDQSFDTREEAVAAARKKAPSVMDFMTKTLVPRMQEAYLAQGDVEKAEAWGKWAEEKQSRKAMAEWASAWRAASMGDIEKAADHVFNLYKVYDDGITPLSKEVVKDKDGNITGFNVTLKTDATGEKRTQFIDKSALTEMGLSALSPPQMFEAAYKRQIEADKTAAAFRAEAAKEARAEQREIAKEGRAEARDNRKASRDQSYEIEKLTIQEQLKAAGADDKTRREVDAKVNVLRKAGYSEEFINGALPSIIGIGDFKKKTSPEEARRMLHTERLKDTYGYARKSPDDQRTILDEDMKMIYGDPKAAPAPSASPAATGLPAQPQARPGGIPVYDTKTGQIVYR